LMLFVVYLLTCNFLRMKSFYQVFAFFEQLYKQESNG
jgi:hypothetical protein